MSELSPIISIIIPARPGSGVVASADAALRLDYPKERLEIIVAKGKQPSVQRNQAVQRCRGEWIYFLDDDAIPAPDNFHRVLEYLRDPGVAMVGGPNICPASAPFIEQVFAVVLSSWLAFGPSRARYTPLGTTRPSSEKELILCNLLARKSSFLECGGFDESLYPNEENALMDALERRGLKLLYDPELKVERRPRPTLRAFARMVFTYGRGRAEQFKLHPTLGSLPNFVPPLFLLWVILLPFTGILGGLLTLPYLFAVLVQVGLSIPSHGFLRSVCSAPLIVLTHLGYGLGFWKGLFSPKPKASMSGAKSSVPVELNWIQK